jgi:hypothetical protein
VAKGTPFEVTHCHCTACRRASGAAFVTWATFRAKNFTYTKGRPAKYKSSPRGIRSFCPRCGTALTFVNPKIRNEVDLAVCSTDHPERFHPETHTWTKRQLPWIKLNDKLPRLAGELKRRTS